MKILTVGELKETLKDAPNDTIVRLTSDTGVDQGQFGDIVVESAHYTHYMCTTGEYLKFFDIYANEVEVEDEMESEV